MAIRDSMRAGAAPLLRPGETVQAVLPAQTINPLLYVPMVLMAVVPAILIVLIAEPFRVIVVTDRRILVCRSGKVRSAEVGNVVATCKRSTEIGPARGLWRFKCRSLGEEPLYIPRRFFADVRQADTLRAGS